MSEEELCWICLEGADAPGPMGNRLFRPCPCPRVVHSVCLAKWQLSNAGRSEEKECRFCKAQLPDWQAHLSLPGMAAVEPVMSVHFRGRTYMVKVKPGEQGRLAFIRDVRRMLKLKPEQEFNITFECKVPGHGMVLDLKGLSSYDAAVFCAAMTAVERQRIAAEKAAKKAVMATPAATASAAAAAAQQQQQAHAAASAAASTSGSGAGGSGGSDHGAEASMSTAAGGGALALTTVASALSSSSGSSAASDGHGPASPTHGSAGELRAHGSIRADSHGVCELQEGGTAVGGAEGAQPGRRPKHHFGLRPRAPHAESAAGEPQQPQQAQQAQQQVVPVQQQAAAGGALAARAQAGQAPLPWMRRLAQSLLCT